MTYEVKYAYTSHIGRIRENNEDNFWCCKETLPACNQGTEGVHAGRISAKNTPVMAVFDGMGGESCGEIAAWIAAQEFGRYYGEHKRMLKKEPENFIRTVCESMNRKVCDYGEQNRISSMGTTAAMLFPGTDGIYAGNLGDSRIYQFADGKFRRISTDHVEGRRMFGKAPLTQYLGIMEESFALDPSIRRLEYGPGSRFLICSDGLTDMLTDGEIADILAREIPVEETVAILLERALKKGGRDNITIILCETAESEETSIQAWMHRLRKV